MLSSQRKWIELKNNPGAHLVLSREYFQDWAFFYLFVVFKSTVRSLSNTYKEEKADPQAPSWWMCDVLVDPGDKGSTVGNEVYSHEG